MSMTMLSGKTCTEDQVMQTTISDAEAAQKLILTCGEGFSMFRFQYSPCMGTPSHPVRMGQGVHAKTRTGEFPSVNRSL